MSMGRAAFGSRVHINFLWVCLILSCKRTAGTTYQPSTTTPETTQSPTTTPPPTTTPYGPPGWCFYEGDWYDDGATITTDSNGCGGRMCSGGEIVWWDAWCMFFSSTLSTTTPPHTTTPGGEPGSCYWNGVWYPNGKDIEPCPNPLCCGLICDHGSVYAWDDICSPALNPPPDCDGWNEYVSYQCCPICHVNTTTTAPTTIPQTTTTTTTTSPLPFCFHNGQIYNNYDVFDLDPNGCHGHECHYGIIRPWRKHCFVSENNCNGTLLNVTGECCPICQHAVSERTTLPSTDTQSISVSTPESTPATSKVCVIRGETYALNMRTNSDECNKCYCTLQGESCHRTICEDVSDCMNTYRLKGECCFVCSHSNSVSIPLFLLVAVVLIKEIVS